MAKVLCSVCDHEIRKSEYDVRRHWESHHKDRLDRGEKASWKLPSKGSGSLNKFVVENKKIYQEEKKEIERTDVVEHEINTLTETM